MLNRWVLLAWGSLLVATARGEARILDDGLHHLRAGGTREWSSFPAAAEADHLRLTFDAAPNRDVHTLRLRQQDVKQSWRVRLNGRELGQLTQDENDLWIYFPVPAGTLVEDGNSLVIEPADREKSPADDIQIGEIAINDKSPQEWLTEGELQITVVDQGTGERTPSRITIVDEAGALQALWVQEDPAIAARAGTIYTADGNASCGLPAGRYTLFAGRGFEYSLATQEVNIQAGQSLKVSLAIRREVPTEGYIACDTHIHSRTHSGHGDATVEERLVTIAGEGIELAVATDHNVPIDHHPVATKFGVREYFTPVVGNEVTTPVGHFNIFPVDADSPPPNHRLRDWDEIFSEIERVSDPRVVILNHGRDLHSGFRPFAPENFNDVVATSVHGWPIGFNAMEVINSGATQTDAMQLFHDWMSLLNAGAAVTPVGSSDSHDVLRHFVGQGRTYIRCADDDPGAIDVDEAVQSLREGHVMVSYGLLAEMHVGRSSAGDLARVSSEKIPVDIRVLAPHWVEANRVELFMNGLKVGEHKIVAVSKESAQGVKWQGRLEISRPKHDVHLVAIARGPGIDRPYWRTAKPYQPLSAEWQSQTIGCSGAIWIDADGDGERTSAKGYAERLWEQAGGQLVPLLESLNGYDEAVAAHAAGLFSAAGNSLLTEPVREALQQAPVIAKTGFRSYLDAWRATQMSAAPGR